MKVLFSSHEANRACQASSYGGQSSLLMRQMLSWFASPQGCDTSFVLSFSIPVLCCLSPPLFHCSYLCGWLLSCLHQIFLVSFPSCLQS